MSIRCGWLLGSILFLCAPLAAAEQVIKIIPVGGEPAFSISNADGTRIYVGNVATTDVTVIDTASDSVIATILLPHNPGTVDSIHLTMAPNGALVYAVDENITSTGTVNVISTAENSVLATIPVGKRPTSIVIRPDGTEAYVVNDDGTSLSVISSTDWRVTTLSLDGYYPLHVTFSPDSRRAYVTRHGLGNSGGLTILDTVSRSVLGTIDGAESDNAPFVSPDGAKLYLTHYDPAANEHVVLRVISTDTGKDTHMVTTSLTGPVASAWLAIPPDAGNGYVVSRLGSIGQFFNGVNGLLTGAVALPGPAAYPTWDATTGRVFVAHSQNNLVSAIDSTSGTIVEAYQTGNQPWSVTIAAGKKYVTNRADGTVSVIGENRAPVANDSEVATAEDTGVALVVTASDPEREPLSFRVIAQPSHGQLSGSAPNLIYTPARDYSGSDTFTFVANDGTRDSAPAMVSIAISAVNDAPSFVKGPDQAAVAGAGLQTVAAWATSLSAGPSNEAAQNLHFVVSNDNPVLFSEQPVVAPNGTLTYKPAATGSGVAHVTVHLYDDGGTANGGVDVSAAQTFTIGVPFSTSTSVTASVNASTFGQAVTLKATVASGGGAVTGSVQFVDGLLSLGTMPLNDGMAALTTPAISAGTRSITAVYVPSGNFASSTSPALTQMVSRATTMSALTITPYSPAYSDIVTFTASIGPSSVAGQAPATTVAFKVGTQTVGTAPLKMVGGVYQATWKGPLVEPTYGTQPAGQMKPGARMVVATFIDANPNFTVSKASRPMSIYKEDARVAYVGLSSISIGSNATVPLTVTVKDISAAIGDPEWDRYPGDIRNAQVAFIDRGTNTILGTVNVTIGNDPTVGTATYNWPVDLWTAKSKTYTIGFIVTNYYYRNSPAENATVVVSK